MSNPNDPQLLTRYDSWLLNRASGETQEALSEFTLAIQSGQIALPTTPLAQQVLAGGVNYCPNSDIKFSKFALANVGTVPETGDDAFEAARFYRQQVGADITKDSAHALKATGHSLFAANEDADHDIPSWDRSNGQIALGKAAGGTQWDVAVNLYNNAVNAAGLWYIRMVLGALTADIVPDDVEIFVGIWEKTASTQRWITGSQLVLTEQAIGIAGTKHLNYVVVATNDSGNILYSQVLNVTTAPDAFDTTNDIPGNSVSYPRLSFAGVAGQGFIQFKIYREDVAAGTIYQIADIRDANSFVFDDQGAKVNMGTPLAAFPSGADKPEAKAISQSLMIGPYGGILLINDFTIRVPAGYDISQTLAGEQYLRFGFTAPTAVARQIRLDKIYLGPSFNKYSDCPFDPVGAIASSQPTSGTPTGGGSGGGPPDPGSGGCVRHDTPVLRLDFDRKHEWLPYANIPQGDLLENGETVRNVVRQLQPSKTRVLYFVRFSNGVWIPVSKRHRFRTSEAGDPKEARHLRKGDQVWGWSNGVPGQVTVTGVQTVVYDEDEDIGTFSLVGEAGVGDHFYIAGFSEDGNSGVFNYNRKEDPGDGFLLQ